MALFAAAAAVVGCSMKHRHVDIGNNLRKWK